MGKNSHFTSRYLHPLPMEPISLPQLVLHNPLSWVQWVFSYITATNKLPHRIPIAIDEDQILVKGEKYMKYLWEHGFFGTGTLSRSEPTWLDRAQSRLLTDSCSLEKRQLEQITQLRRKQRLAYKKERARFEKRKLELRKQGILEEQILQEEQEMLRTLRSQELNWKPDSSIDDRHIRPEDAEVLNEDSTVVRNLESLGLLAVEAIFLTTALPVLDCSSQDLILSILGPTPSIEDIINLCQKYVAYHHYRSHGWCVRSGIKFGCEYLLYRRGPPFQHAEFCVMVLDSVASPHDYTRFATAARVSGGAQKQLVLCYVSMEIPDEKLRKLWNQGEYLHVFSSFRVHELVYRRWVPGKNRD